MRNRGLAASAARTSRVVGGTCTASGCISKCTRVPSKSRNKTILAAACNSPVSCCQHSNNGRVTWLMVGPPLYQHWSCRILGPDLAQFGNQVARPLVDIGLAHRGAHVLHARSPLFQGHLQ